MLVNGAPGTELVVNVLRVLRDRSREFQREERMKSSFSVSIAFFLAGSALAITIDDTNSQEIVVNADPGAYPVVDASFLSALEWRFVGPYRGGRVVAVAGVPGDPLVYCFGAAHGGVWKTTDAGMNWRNDSKSNGSG
jgi:hypothetical protein